MPMERYDGKCTSRRQNRHKVTLHQWKDMMVNATSRRYNRHEVLPLLWKEFLNDMMMNILAWLPLPQRF